MNAFVRAIHPVTGAEITVTARYADTHKLKIVDKPATYPDGRPLPAKPRKTITTTTIVKDANNDSDHS